MVHFKNSVRENPKITATIVFIIIISIIMFRQGYINDKKSFYTNTQTDHIWAGLKWVVGLYIIIFLIGLLLTVFFGIDGSQLFFAGGNLISLIFQLIATVLIELAK